MTEQETKIFLNDLIAQYPGYKTKITNREAFVSEWFHAFATRKIEDMLEAGKMWKARRPFFPTTKEFIPYMCSAVATRCAREQMAREQMDPTPPEDQEKIDFIIRDIFGG